MQSWRRIIWISSDQSLIQSLLFYLTYVNAQHSLVFMMRNWAIYIKSKSKRWIERVGVLRHPFTTPVPPCTILHQPAPSCTTLHQPAPSCTTLHHPVPTLPCPTCTALSGLKCHPWTRPALNVDDPHKLWQLKKLKSPSCQKRISVGTYSRKWIKRG